MAHAKDRDASGSFVAAGKGVVDFPLLPQAPCRSGTLTGAGDAWPAAGEAPEVAAFLRRTLAETGHTQHERKLAIP